MHLPTTYHLSVGPWCLWWCSGEAAAALLFVFLFDRSQRVGNRVYDDMGASMAALRPRLHRDGGVRGVGWRAVFVV